MPTDGTSNPEAGIVEAAGIGGYEALYEQSDRMWKSSNLVTQSGDPYQIMLEGKRLQESEYSGLEGFARRGIHELYGKVFSREDPDLAENQYESAINDEDRVKALKLQAAGDVTGAGRQEIENQYNIEERSVDGHDSQHIQRVQALRAQALANYDADSARQSQYQEAHANDQIQAFQEEAKEAQLRGEGRTDDARTAALQFSTEQRVKSLQEAAEAESDPTRKSQLQREAAATDDAGKIERDALQQELHRTQMSNTQASALSGASPVTHGLSALHDGGSSNLSEAVRKLDDATVKLNKALSHSKTLVLVKD